MTRWRMGARVAPPPSTVLGVLVDIEHHGRRLRVHLGAPVGSVHGQGELWFGPRGAMRPILDVVDLDTDEHLHLDADAHEAVALELYARGLLA